jgi:hypothetical protein
MPAERDDAAPPESLREVLHGLREELQRHSEACDPGPWWSQKIKDWGPSTLVLVVFLGMFTGWIPSPVSQTLAEVRQLRIDFSDYVRLQMRFTDEFAPLMRTDSGHIADLARFKDDQSRLLRNICRNTAKSLPAQDNCDR